MTYLNYDLIFVSYRNVFSSSNLRWTLILRMYSKVGDIIYADRDDGAEQQPLWHVYVTGHSLGGALATLLALELSSSQLAK